MPRPARTPTRAVTRHRSFPGTLPTIARPTPPVVAKRTAFGTLATQTGPINQQAEYNAGERLAMYEVNWRDWETVRGTLLPARSTNHATNVANMRAKGFKVVLGLGLHYKPTWYNALATSSNALFKVNQLGETATSFNNMVFSQTSRDIAAEYIDKLNDVLPLSQFHALRITSGDRSEVLYPESQGTGQYAWWGFDAAALGGPDLADGQEPNPWPSWRPGQALPAGQTNVAPWLDWYIRAMMNTVKWQEDLYASYDFDGWDQYVVPGAGTTPATWTNLRNNTTLLTNNVAGVGAVWERVAALAPYKPRTVFHCSSIGENPLSALPTAADLDVPINSTVLNGWGSARRMRRYAAEYGLRMSGENPGYGLGVTNAYYTDLSDTGLMSTFVRTITQPGVEWDEAYWAHSFTLFDGTIPNGIAEYAARIGGYYDGNPPPIVVSPGQLAAVSPAARSIVASITAAGTVVSAMRTSGATLSINAQIVASVDIARVFDAEGGAVGDTLTAANTGATSVSLTGAGTAQFVATPTHSGGVAYQFSSTGADVAAMTLPVASDVTKDIEVTGWLYVSGPPTTSGIRLMTLRYASGTTLFLRYLGTGRLELQNSAGVTVATAGTNFPVNTWTKIGIRCHVGTTTADGTADVIWYNAAGAQLGYLTLPAGNTNTANIVGVTVGKTNTDVIGNVLTVTTDDLLITGPRTTMYSPGALPVTAAITAAGTLTAGTKASVSTRTVTATITAAGTVATVPTPPSANLLFRFRGDDAPGANGAGAATWPAAPGMSLPDLLQATAIYQPLNADNAANGHRGLVFDGINDRMEATGPLLDAFRNRTGVIVAMAIIYPTTVSGSRTVVGFSRGTTNDANRTFVGNRGSSGFVAAGGRTLDTDSGAFLNSPAAMAASPVPQFIIARFDYTATDLQLYVNGVLVATNSNYQAATVTSDTASMAGFIGASVLGTTENFAGTLLEVLAYSTASTTTVADLHTYLQATYLPTGSGSRTATRAVTATITAAGSVSTTGAMPVGDLPGWTQVFADDFNYNFAEGTITPNGSGFLATGPAAATLGAKFTFYPDGWVTTHGNKVYPKTVGEPGYIAVGQPGYPAQWPAINSRYYPSKTLSCALSTPDNTAQGVMQIRQSTELISGVSTALGATIKPRHPNGNYMGGPYVRYAFRMRVRQAKIGGVDYAPLNNYTTSPNLYHIHVPLSIDSENWGSYGIPNGEFNHPDCDVNRKIKSTYHPAANPDESWSFEPSPTMSPYEWHIYETIWEPGRVRFLIDGVVWKDTTDRVPSMEMAICVFQHESNWRQPDPTGEAITEIDWVVMYDRV